MIIPPLMADLFAFFLFFLNWIFCHCSKDCLMQVCFVCASVWSSNRLGHYCCLWWGLGRGGGGVQASVFICSYSHISIFSTVLSGSYVKCVCVCTGNMPAHTRASLNTQWFHKTDPPGAVGGPNTIRPNEQMNLKVLWCAGGLRRSMLKYLLHLQSVWSVVSTHGLPLYLFQPPFVLHAGLVGTTSG